MTTRYLVDTAAFIWAVQSPDRLSKATSRIFAREDVQLELSAVSLLEIAIKHSSGKLDFDREDAVEGIAALRLRVLPVREAHVLQLFSLPLRHRDPFDRLIIAQAMAERIAVITADKAFSRYPLVDVVW